MRLNETKRNASAHPCYLPVALRMKRLNLCDVPIVFDSAVPFLTVATL
jgi:hypothetical protein